MNGYREDTSPYCYFHPKEVFVGVCPICLNERLLVLAAKQKGHPPNSSSSYLTRSRVYRTTHHNKYITGNGKDNNVTYKNPLYFPKIFALPSFLNKHWRSHDDDAEDLDNYDHYASPSPEDSFISIKFEKNGDASWDKKGTMSKVSLENWNNKTWNYKSEMGKENKMSVIEHAKIGPTLRWRKRIGHIFHLIKWKRSNKASVGHAGTKMEGGKIRNKSWIRTLSKRRTKEQL